MTGHWRFIYTAVLGFLLAVAAQAADTRRIETVNNADYFGFDLRAEKDVSLDQCKSICLRDSDCRAFTFNEKAQWCFLKSDFNVTQPFDGAIAGKVVSVSGEPDLGAPPPLSFISEGLENEAANARRNIGPRPIDSGLFGLISTADLNLAAGQFGLAAERLRGALSIDPSDASLWLDLSKAAIGLIGRDGNRDYRVQREATSAALNAYRLSRNATDRAAALDSLAKALEIRQLFRPALESYKASLALVRSPQVLADYRDLQARKGFRVVNHTVDADGNQARICVRFSDPLLKSGVDYRNFVALDDRTASTIRVEEEQICADGLEHGRSYRLTLRNGLPSAVGEVLDPAVTINTYVRDRAPFVRFTGDNFVLPGKARRGIPVVTVNTPTVEVELFRIGDRSLAPVLANSQFLRQLDGYDARRVRDEIGEPVWQGTLDVRFELNRETTTSFPIDEAVPDRKPGVYVLMARAANDQPDSWTPRATQWLVVSDIGLSTFSGTDGLNVFARSLATARPESGVTLSLVARNNELLDSAVTDEDGRVRFAPGLLRGKAGLAPAVVTADNGAGDFVFLDMTKAGFDLSDRGVTGRAAPGPIDILAWTERGIYRAGETVHLTALARDDAATAISGLPLTFIVQRPDGKEERRLTHRGGQRGGYEIGLDLPSNAMHGSWTVRIHTDPKTAALVESRFLVEDFRPDRIEFDLSAPEEPLQPGEVAAVGVDGRFLYGAPAAGLALEAGLRLKTDRTLEGHPGYRFGLADEEETASEVDLGALPKLDADGKATIDIELGTLPATTRPLVADLAVRVREGGGRAVERTVQMPVQAPGPMIGIKPEFENDLVGEGSVASFRVIAVDPQDQAIAMTGLRWSLLRVIRQYQWYREGGSWRYEPIEYTELATDGSVDVDAVDGAEIAATVNWGRYRLEIESDDPNGPATSVEFNAGWYVSSASTETPDGLEVALDREVYQPGDTARLQVSPRFAGEVLVTVAGDELHEVFTETVPAEGTEIAIPVKAGWGAGAYVTATLIRPGDGVETRMPSRAVGVKWLSVDPGDRSLDVKLDVPDKIRPNTTLDIPISVAGSNADQARIVIAAVDVGILNLTRYQPPDPEGWYFGQRRLGVEMRDLYGRLIDGSLGVAGSIRTGGDGPGAAITGSAPKERLVALYSGIIDLDADGKGTVSFDIPQFNGTVRLMAVAWTESGVGNAMQDVIVRDPLVITSSLPQFLAPGDASRLRLDIANTDGPEGDYNIAVQTTGPLDLQGAGGLRTVRLAPGETTSFATGIKAGRPGDAEIVITMTGPDDLVLQSKQPLTVRPPALPETRRIEVPLAANGGAIVVDRELLAASYLGGSSVSVSVSNSRFDVPSLLMSLDRYPYGCTEQTTSRALPLLYVNDFDAPAALLADKGLRERVQTAIERVLANQSSAGSFGLWSPGGGDLWLDAYVTDFLSRAHEKKYAVPAQALRLALDNLQNVLGYTDDVAGEGDSIAYASYVLAQNRRAAAGDLRYYVDTRLDEFETPIARAQLAAALALYGDAARSERAFASAYRLATRISSRTRWQPHYGSPLRNDAAMLALAGESRPVTPLLGDMVQLVSDRLTARPARTTQEQAWSLLAARAAVDADAGLSLRVDGVASDGAFNRTVAGQDLLDDPIRIENDSDSAVVAVVTSIAAPVDPPQAGGDGFTIARNYFDMNGQPVSIEAVEQNQRYVVVLTVQQTTELGAHIVVTDLLPAGLEIDNPRLIESARTSGFEWLGETTPAHTEFRSDRFVAAFDAAAGRRDRFTVAYVVRAATPGIYTHPAARVEDMYRPYHAAQTATRWMEVKAPAQ